jgi:hypothetical protein
LNVEVVLEQLDEAMSLSPFSPLQALRELTPLQAALCSTLSIPLILLLTWLYTSINFYNATSASQLLHSGSRGKPSVPPYLPYAVPWLGSTISFLDKNQGRFWRNLRSRLGATNDACTILLGGMPTYILAAGADSLMKQTKITDRARFDEIVMRQGFGTGKEDFEKFARTAHGMMGGKGKLTLQESLYHEYLLAPSQVNVLTSKFVETFKFELAELGSASVSGDLVRIIRDAMFRASTTAFMGSKVLELCPNWAADFWAFDRDMLQLFYGLPRFLSKDVHAALQRLLDAGEKWHNAARENFDAKAAKDLDWEPWYGSLFLRERQVMYETAGMSARGSVSPDIGFLFGLSSNAIPATTWTLCHILTSGDKTLLPDLMDELVTIQRPDGSLNINKLVQLPLLSSTYSETLRVYVDVLVTRTVNQSFTLPSSLAGHPGHLLEKGNIAMAPSYLSHHDPVFWSTYGEEAVDPEIWHCRRFLSQGKYSTSGTSNKLFPYGGGNHMCPGRVFAKQEILAAIAIVLLTFDIEVEEDESLPGVRRQYNGTGVVSMDKGLAVSMRRK